MPYSHIARGQLKAQLASRLDDDSKTYWLDDELNGYINEALRTWGILSGFWRERGNISIAPTTAIYDVPSTINAGLLDYTVTDYDLTKAIQYHFLETVSSQATWNGTEMFSLSDISDAIYRRMNQFLQDTGIIVTPVTLPIPSPPGGGRIPLSDDTIDVRRMLWIDSDERIYHLWREDEFTLTAHNLMWSVSPDTPYAYSVMTSRPVEVQIAPPPIVSSQLKMLVVQGHAALNPISGSTTLKLFDDLTPFIKWGAMADCLGNDGPARDPVRAQFCEQRYQQGVGLTKLLSSVIACRINDIPTRPVTVHDLDAMYHDWQNQSGPASELGFAGWNIMAVHPVPDAVASATLDVVRKAPIPQNDGSFVQIGREQIGSILDYAEHLALFKVGGEEFDSTQRQAQDFLLEAVTFNYRLSASARYIINSKVAGQEEKDSRPRVFQSSGMGAMPAVNQNA